MALYLWYIRGVVVLNMICLFLGIVLALVACYPIINYGSIVFLLFGEKLTQDFRHCRLIVIFTGCVASVISGFGITLGTTPHRLFSIIYIIASIVVVICSAIACIYELELMYTVSPDKVDLRELFDPITLETQEGLNRIHFLQKKFRCCGVEGPYETFGEKSSSVYPYSCCGLDYPSVTCKKDIIYTAGCQSEIATSFLHTNRVVMALCLVIMSFHIISIVLIIQILRTFEFSPIDEQDD